MARPTDRSEAVDVSELARVAVLAPNGQDGALAARILGESGIGVQLLSTVHDLGRLVTDESLGAAVVTEEGLGEGADRILESSLAEQPQWSDLPLLLLTTGAPQPSEARLARLLFRLGNVTLLERPMARITFITAVQMALRQRRHQYEMRALLREQEVAVERRDHFMAMLGHELRNPLAAIQMATQAGEPGDPEAMARHCEIVSRQARHLQRLVDDLLEVSRISLGRITLERVPLDLRELARHALESLDASVKARDLTLVLEADPGPVGIVGDPVRIEQVINNLVTNAIRFTPPGGRIEVFVHRENGTAVLRVSDTGEGIPPEQLTGIFELFAQADETGRRHRGGLGIGLALVERLVRLHGGAVAAYSEGPGTGAHFVVRLPLRTAVRAVAEGERAGNGGRTDGDGAPPPRRRLVLVEDDDDNRELLSLLLRRRGFEVHTAASGIEAVEVLARVRPQVALVDIGLPDIDGYEVARRARATLGGGVLLVALTGYGHGEAQRRTREAGFDMHLTKPLDLDAFDALARRGPPGRPVGPPPPG